MSLALLKPSRCVLLIGDEALFVYNVTGRGAKLVDTVPWQAEDFADVVSTLIKRECGGKPVLMLNDMTDQHFKGGQRLPKVGPMDRGNVLMRRLTVAFPNYAIRGALPVKEMVKGAARPKAVAGGLYLFAAVPVSEAIKKTVESVRLSMAPIAGFALLPVEASDMVYELAQIVAGKERRASKWAVFIGQHQNGALRQVITRDGQLAMTRMTPVVDSDSDPNAWADEVAQEFKATVSYLSRFGYSAEDGTDVIVIAGEQAGSALERRVGIPCNYVSFTAQEAARELGLSIGFQEEERYADALHVAWSGRKNKFILPMQAPELASIHKPRQAVAALVFALFLGGGYLAWTMMGHINTMMNTSGELSSQRRVLQDVETDYNIEVARMETLGFDVKLVQGSIAAYQTLEKDGLQTLAQLKKIREALGDTLRLDELKMTRIPAAVPAAGVPPELDANGQPIIPRPQMETAMQLSFPPTIDPEEGAREVISLERRLRAAFPGYAVAIEKNVVGMEYTETMSGETGANVQEQTEDYIAVLSIKGALP
ncbi:MAG: hypothetical protein KKA05_07640 [Alphaproteobacteria bacterium]|nr:hypothetical protein [Alphaproteobacteria bacterium]